MAVVALATRMRLGVWGVRTMQARGFVSDGADNVESSGGSVRDAGGAFAKREKAEEDRYFRQKTKEQLSALKEHHEDEIVHHKKEIERLQKEIERHKHRIKKLKLHDE
ncbi:PREDICTED: ATPase inhibitor, mitochondrial [Condylura cristata]|uniref:ATPase inhibitor, mitochondrial n=1 Tax=Condylura cristata TaxID=143302 RepID=UPI0003347C64|nr:PREDICTED: ATPase inhibitor, mitochondrial [Condylura cristata]